MNGNININGNIIMNELSGALIVNGYVQGGGDTVV